MSVTQKIKIGDDVEYQYSVSSPRSPSAPNKYSTGVVTWISSNGRFLTIKDESLPMKDYKGDVYSEHNVGIDSITKVTKK